MKKLLLAAVLGAALTFTNVAAAADDYIMTPGDQLQIYVLGHPDISSTRANSDSSYTVRPDGKLDLSPRRKAYAQMDDDGAVILAHLKETGGILGERLVHIAVQQLHPPVQHPFRAPCRPRRVSRRLRDPERRDEQHHAYDEKRRGDPFPDALA